MAKEFSGRFQNEDWSTSPSEGAEIECRDRSASDLALPGERSETQGAKCRIVVSGDLVSDRLSTADAASGVS